jgi:hypothetical protein
MHFITLILRVQTTKLFKRLDKRVDCLSLVMYARIGYKHLGKILVPTSNQRAIVSGGGRLIYDLLLVTADLYFFSSKC